MHTVEGHVLVHVYMTFFKVILKPCCCFRNVHALLPFQAFFGFHSFYTMWNSVHLLLTFAGMEQLIPMNIKSVSICTINCAIRVNVVKCFNSNCAQTVLPREGNVAECRPDIHCDEVTQWCSCFSVDSHTLLIFMAAMATNKTIRD